MADRQPQTGELISMWETEDKGTQVVFMDEQGEFWQGTLEIVQHGLITEAIVNNCEVVKDD